ncbi:MAG: Rap1a/Tai family immunity protein [Pseudomonadota bacterium]
MNRTTIISAAVLLSTVMCGNVTAETEDVSGALLKKLCASYVDRPASTFDGMCIGYVVGVMSVVEYTKYFCRPMKSTHSQATLVVKKYLSEHPEKLHLDADGLVLEALIEAFPCPKSLTD